MSTEQIIEQIEALYKVSTDTGMWTDMRLLAIVKTLMERLDAAENRLEEMENRRRTNVWGRD